MNPRRCRIVRTTEDLIALPEAHPLPSDLPSDVNTVVAYLRTANGGRAAQQILDRQRAALNQAIGRYGWTVAAWVQDIHQSGLTLNRPGLQQALTLLASGYVDALLCWNLDRLIRGPHEIKVLAAHMDQLGWDLITVESGIPTLVDLLPADR
jgi:site-specific DNA recombinase